MASGSGVVGMTVGSADGTDVASAAVGVDVEGIEVGESRGGAAAKSNSAACLKQQSCDQKRRYFGLSMWRIKGKPLASEKERERRG